jgi:serine/threonine protein kinase
MAWGTVAATVSVERLREEQGDDAAAREIERRMVGADEPSLMELLRQLGTWAVPIAVPILFRYLPHGSKAVADQARRVLQTLGWEKVLATVENWARQEDVAAGGPILDGLAVFEARPDQVRLLDRLTDIFRGDLRVRAFQLWQQKRLSLGLERLSSVFREHQPNYRLERVLGQGLFTAAYFARHQTVPQLEVVVRVLSPEFAAKPDIRGPFLDLCKTAMLVNHYNLARTFDVGEIPSEDLYYILRQHIPGTPLQEILARGRRFTLVQVLEILRQLLDVLAVIHVQGVAHGGVKPSNLFVCSGDRVILGDLSLPPQGFGDTSQARLAYDYRYIAPEILLGGRVSSAGDLYALGCVAHELLFGAPPFTADHPNEVLLQHATRPVTLPRRDDLPAHLGSMLLWLLAKGPGERPGSAAEALQGLRPSPRAAAPSAVGPAAEVAAGRTPVALLRDASLAAYHHPRTVFSMGASLRRPPSSPRSALDDPRMAAGALVLPGYEIIQELGHGRSGVVYKARQTAFNRLVALKIIRTDYCTDAAEWRQLLARVQAARELQHPNIAEVYEVGEHGGSPFLSVELLEGGTLAERIRSGLDAEKVAAQLLEKLARATEYAHTLGILHLDLKPANVLLSASGEPKITDFGLARQRSVDQPPTEGKLAGPLYIAPEQAVGHFVGVWTDIYSLGAILYALLTGDAWTAVATPEQIRRGEPLPPRQLNPSVSPDLERICLKCLERSESRRYRSAVDVAEELRRFREGEAIQG